MITGVATAAIVDLAPLPLVLPYLVHPGLVAAGAVAVLLVPEPVVWQPGPVRLEVQRLSVPADVRPECVHAGIAGLVGFSVLGFLLLLHDAISIPVIGVGAGAQVCSGSSAAVFAGLVALLALAAFAGLVRRA